MKETYQIVSVKDGKQDMDAILHVLRNIKTGTLKNDLKLLNYYHEVPITYGAKIDSIDGDCVEVSVQQAQSVVLGIQKQTLLTSSHFPQGLGVHCFVEFVNVKNCFAVLGRFAYASIRAHRRGAVRVKVEGVIAAAYSAEGQVLDGHITDISVTGVALQNHQDAPAGLAENGVLHVTLQGTKVDMSATYVKSKKHDDLHIHSFKIEPGKNADNLISQYIYTRQVEIIRQLKEQLL